MILNLKKIIYSVGVSGLLLNSTLNATTLRESIVDTLNLNHNIASEHYNKKYNRYNIKEQQADYYPTLDFEIFVEESRTYHDSEDNTKEGWGRKNGYDATLKFEQIIYDGGQTPSEIEQYRHRYYDIKYTSNTAVEDTILELTNTYLDLILNQSLIAFGDFKIVAHDYYLGLAKKKEDVSGEILDRLQVQSKIQAIVDNNLNVEVKTQKLLSTYTKLSGKKISGNICRPILNENLIPSTLEEAIDVALKNNNKIRAQYEKIQEQKALVEVTKAKFRPNLKFQLEGKWDNDLSLPENGQEDIYRARVISAWNWYEGGKDKITLEKEKIAILEQRKILDSIKSNITEEIEASYNTYFQMKKRIKNLKEFVDINNKIVEVYKEQLKEGSRTFLDLLNAETEVFRTRIMLEEEEINKYKEYFKILRNLNKLSDTVLIQKNQVCSKFDINTIIPNYKEEYKNKEEDSIEDISKSLGLEEE